MTSIFTVERTWNETLIEQTRRHVNFTLATERKKHKQRSKQKTIQNNTDYDLYPHNIQHS